MIPLATDDKEAKNMKNGSTNGSSVVLVAIVTLYLLVIVGVSGLTNNQANNTISTGWSIAGAIGSVVIAAVGYAIIQKRR